MTTQASHRAVQEKTGQSAKRLLRRKAVEEKTGLSTSALYEKMAAGEFPKPIKLGTRSVTWVEEEVDAEIDRRIAKRDAGKRAA